MIQPPCPRGVYLLPWRAAGGERYLAAVNRAGVRIMEAMVAPGGLPKMRARLWELLDEYDPTPDGRRSGSTSLTLLR